MTTNSKNQLNAVLKLSASSRALHLFSLLCVALLAMLLCSCAGSNVTEDMSEGEGLVDRETTSGSHEADFPPEERRVHVAPADTYTIIETKVNQRFEETPDYAETFDYDFDEECTDVSFDEESDTVVIFDNKHGEVNGEGAAYEDGCLTITEAGTYVLRGVMAGGAVVVDAGKDDVVHIVLDNVAIKTKEGPSLNVKKCDDCIITLADGSVNSLEDSNNYPQKDSSKGANATLFSSCDLTLNGGGSLCVLGNYNHAISSKDDLIVMSGNYDITSQHDGFHGRDSVRIFDGTYVINVVGDGIDATNAEDDDKGYVCLNGGSYTIKAGDDAVQAESHIRMAPGVSF